MSPLGLTIISVIIVIIIAYFAITRILPIVRRSIEGLISNNIAMAGFMSLLIVVVYILVLNKIVELLLEIEGNTYLSYLNLVTPAISILMDILPYIKYIILGVLIAWGFKSCKK